MLPLVTWLVTCDPYRRAKEPLTRCPPGGSNPEPMD